MGKRGPKSAVELATIRPIRPVSAYDRQASPREQAPAADHLRPATKAWWGAVLADYQLELHQLRVPQVAAEAWNRKEQARKALAAYGLTFTDDRGGVRPRPHCHHMRGSSAAMTPRLVQSEVRITPKVIDLFIRHEKLRPVYDACDRNCKSGDSNRFCLECRDYVEATSRPAELLGAAPFQTSSVDADGPQPPSDADPLRAAAWHCSWAMRVALQAAERNYSLTASVGEAVVK
jgi:hypothetical protein